MLELDRRSLLRALGASGATLAAGCALFGSAPNEGWVRELAALCRDVKAGTIRPAVWQSDTEALLGELDVPLLLQEIGFGTIAADLLLPDLGASTVRLRGLEAQLSGRYFVAELTGMEQDRTVVPHGHRHMVSAHLVLFGEVALRQLDKLSETDADMVVRPTVDKVAGVGSVSSISDARGNVHWMRALSRRAYTLDISVVDLGDARSQIQPIDPLAGRIAGVEAWRVPKLDPATAREKYGKTAWELPV